MNKNELIRAIAKKTGFSMTECRRGLDTTLHFIRDTVKKGGKLTLVGFGTFTSATRKARTCRNPQTGKTMKIGAKRVPKFRAGHELRTAVAK